MRAGQECTFLLPCWALTTRLVPAQVRVTRIFRDPGLQTSGILGMKSYSAEHVHKGVVRSPRYPGAALPIQCLAAAHIGVPFKAILAGSSLLKCLHLPNARAITTRLVPAQVDFTFQNAKVTDLRDLGALGNRRRVSTYRKPALRYPLLNDWAVTHSRNGLIGLHIIFYIHII